jgi:hypothetical protein
MKTMYEVNWHWKNVGTHEVFEKCTVSKITVTREGIRPGCSGVSIDAIDSSGQRFSGDPENYFETEELAWESIKKDIDDSIANINLNICELEQEKSSFINFRKTL